MTTETTKKTVLVTGASRGIGRAIALSFARQGWQTIITCIKNEEKLQEVHQLIYSWGGSCLSYVGDMGDFSCCQSLFSQIERQFGALDVLVNNAGVSQIGLCQDLTIENWERMLKNNLTSVFCCSKLAIPMMLRRHAGSIINISSVWGVSGASCETAYSASKGGVNAFTKALAKELAPSNIQVNAIACGAVETEMNQWMTPEEKDALLEDIPTGRMGRPDEVANLVLQLAHGHPYLTGQIICLDGGWI